MVNASTPTPGSFTLRFKISIVKFKGRVGDLDAPKHTNWTTELTVNAEISPSLLKISCSFIYLFILLQRSFIDLIQRRVHSLGKKLNWRELITLPDPILICLVRGFTWADLRNRTWQKNLFDISLFIVEYPNSGVFF